MNRPRNMDNEILITMLEEEMEAKPYSFLADACAQGDLAEASRLLDSGVSFRDGGCWLFVFQAAIENENTDIIDLLVENGIGLSSFNAVKETIKAADRPWMLEYISLHGAHASRLDHGWSDLQFAARYGRRLILESLIEDGELDPTELDPDGRSLLMLAALSKETDDAASATLEYLLSLNRIDVDAQDNQGQTALMRPAQYGLIRNTELLLQSGANPNIRDHDGRTALMLACAGVPSDEVIRNNATATDSPNRNGERQLLDVNEDNYPEIVRLLLAFGARPELRDPYGYRAIDYAHQRGAEEIVSHLWSGSR